MDDDDFTRSDIDESAAERTSRMGRRVATQALGFDTEIAK
jgi:hypothetical protein